MPTSSCVAQPRCFSAARDAGAECILEHSGDRGLPRSPLFLNVAHASLWSLPVVLDLRRRYASSRITFPHCALRADTQKYTTLLVTPGRPGSQARPPESRTYAARMPLIADSSAA
eukprot:6172719-Pleurochrysis_carterae.AAC.4